MSTKTFQILSAELVMHSLGYETEKAEKLCMSFRDAEIDHKVFSARITKVSKRVKDFSDTMSRLSGKFYEIKVTSERPINRKVAINMIYNAIVNLGVVFKENDIENFD